MYIMQSDFRLYFISFAGQYCYRMQADEVTDKELLFSSTDIADWIIPAIYMGHFSSVVWLKPPWALQITEGQHSLIVGRDKTTGYIR